METTSSPNPMYLSKRGAFNGTGLAAMQTRLMNLTSQGLSSAAQGHGNLLLVFQHYTGDIRFMVRGSTGHWQGGSVYDVVATDAKNGTPISLLSSAPIGVIQHHVFCGCIDCRALALLFAVLTRFPDINNNNSLRQRFIDNQTFTWYDGPLNDLDVSTLDSESVGLQACYYNGPIDSVGSVSLNGTNPNSGMRLFVATSETTFAQYAWRSGFTSWVQEQSNWSGVNGQATPACFGWAAGGTTYVMFVDEQNAIQLYWSVSLLIDGCRTLTLTIGEIRRIMSPELRHIP